MSKVSQEVKDKRAKEARAHISNMRNYCDFTSDSIANSTIYSEYVVTYVDESRHFTTEIVTEKLDSVSAVSKYRHASKLCLLNFASYKNPGGRFLEGSMAQEEAICHSSNLYSVLSNFRFINEFYEPNKKKLNSGLYNSNLIYSPNIVFLCSDGSNIKQCDVITCAAPNKSPIMRYHSELLPKVDIAMWDRIDHILYAAYLNKVETLILGAFGCGVFKNDGTVVATIFKNLLDNKYSGVFSKVVFAVPDDKNYVKFCNVLN